MKNIFVAVFLILFLASCNTSNVAVDYDRGVNFSNIKTFNYYSDNQIQLNRFDSIIFTKSLDQALFSKGLRKSDNPDIMIAIKVYSQQENQINTVNLGLGSGGRWFGIGTNIGIPVRKKLMGYGFQIDMDDAKNKNLIWTGQTSGTTSYGASSDAKTSFYKSKIQSLLKKYPTTSNSKKTKKSNYYN